MLILITVSSKAFFSIRFIFHGHWQFTGQQRKGGDLLLFHSTTSTHLRTFRNLFATLHVSWLSHIFNRIACIYQTATWWDVPPYRITIWLIDDVTLSSCLFTWWLDSSFFCYSNFRRETGGFELASSITLVLQASRLTKCASNPKACKACTFKECITKLSNSFGATVLGFLKNPNISSSNTVSVCVGFFQVLQFYLSSSRTLLVKLSACFWKWLLRLTSFHVFFNER